MRLVYASLGLLLLSACSEAPPPEPPKPMAPSLSVAPVEVPKDDLYLLTVGGNGFKADMRLSDLRTRYGDTAVVEQAVPLGEGQEEPGAIIYPDDPARRAYVYFVDGKTESTISAIYVRDANSTWRGPAGLKIGQSSKDLDRMNGKPFRFLGFDWDYGGYVSNWTDGSLATAFLPPGRLAVRLAPPELADGESLPGAYPSGDGEFPSDLAALREHPPQVVEFGLAFVP